MTRTINNLIEEKRDRFMQILRDQIEGEPRTSWNNILDLLLYDFEAYTDDEASGFIDEQYERGEIDDNEILWQFEQFVMFLEDINEYDTEY